MTLPVPTAKDINDAHLCAKECADLAVDHARRCGKLLIAKKDSMKHGEWGEWIRLYCDFSHSTANIYMKAAVQIPNALGISAVRHLYPSGTPEGQKPKDSPKGAVPVVKAAPAATGETVIERPAAPVSTVTPPAEAEPEWTEADEAAAHVEEEASVRERIEAALAADDKLAAAFEQIKQQQHEITVLKQSRDHYQRQAGEAVRLLKAEQRKVAKLERQQRAA